MKITSGKNHSGFTLVELLVAMSVFIIITVVAVGAFIQSLKSERHLVTQISVANDVNTALEQMARAIRTGYLFSATAPDSQGNNSLSFIDYSGASSTYSIGSGGLLEREDGTGNTVPITSNDVVIRQLSFVVSQIGGNSCYPWRVTILLGVEAAGSSASVVPTYIQTTVSSRTLPRDVPPAFKYSSLGSVGYDISQCK